MMKNTHSTFVYATLLAGVVLLLPGLCRANLANYCHNDKGIFLPPGNEFSEKDTIPPKERENFDKPFGASDYDYTPYTPDPFSNQEDKPSKVIQPTKVDVGDFKPRLHKIPQDYSGFKIEIKKVAKPLSGKNDIFYQHGKLFAEKLSDGSISYMLGDYPTADEAGAFLESFLSKRYPEARVVEYEEGSRLQ
ncbi:MAG: hypothetical protein H6557_29030 [Lewinellaceae bacterium]|nr:hypothetical protein [Phaeodactylibacter sp.]MCB9040691.1 hypothetical protein [Lewinellaceae bacterium]